MNVIYVNTIFIYSSLARNPSTNSDGDHGNGGLYSEYRHTSNISRIFVGYKIVDHSDVVEASPAGAAPTTSSLSI